MVSRASGAGKTYVYALQATWTQEGHQVVRRKSIDVQVGKEYVIDLRREAEIAPPTAGAAGGATAGGAAAVGPADAGPTASGPAVLIEFSRGSGFIAVRQ